MIEKMVSGFFGTIGLMIVGFLLICWWHGEFGEKGAKRRAERDRQQMQPQVQPQAPAVSNFDWSVTPHGNNPESSQQDYPKPKFFDWEKDKDGRWIIVSRPEK